MRSLKNEVSDQFLAAIDSLTQELLLYKEETSIWITSAAAKNSAGHLSLHLIGNLNHFIGHIIGETDYIRDRENEFGGSAVSRHELLAGLTESKKSVKAAFDHLPSSKLSEEFPIQVFGFSMTYQYFIIRLLSHFNYHLGQINYHRRLLD